MTITAQDILTKLGKMPWSGFNSDDMVWDNDEDSKQAKATVNAALAYLINEEDFPFKTSEQTISTSKGTPNYRTPSGQILKIYNKETLKELEYIGDSSLYSKDTTGSPTKFWIDYKNPNTKLRLYPIPDDSYSIGVMFNHFEPVIDAQEGTLKFEFENADDYLNIPFDDDGKKFNLEYLFMQCIVYQSIVKNIVDLEDENYEPMKAEFEKHWNQFVKLANPVKVTPRVVW